MRNIVYKGFIIDPSVELVPNITISPFCKGFGSNNSSMKADENISICDEICMGGGDIPQM